MMDRSKLMSFRTLWSLCPVVLGAAALLIRVWQINTAFEGELRLLIPGAPATAVLTCVLLLSAVLFLVLAIRQKVEQPPRGEQHRKWRGRAMWAQGDTACLALNVGAAFLSLAAAPVLLVQGRELRREHMEVLAMGAEHSNNGMMMLLSGVTALLAFAGLLLAGRDRFRGICGGKGEQMIMLAAVNGGVWLMESYRGGAADPVLWSYAPFLFAIACGMLFYVNCAGLAAGAPHPRRTLWLAAATVVISAAAIPGGRDLGSILLLAAQILAALAVLRRLPMNLEHPPAVDVPAAAEKEIQEEDDHV